MLANVGTGFRCAQKGLSEAKSNIFLRAGGVMSTLKLKLLLCCDFRSLGWLIWRARKFSYLMRRCPLLLLVIVVDDDDKPPNLYNVGQDCSVPPLCSIFFIYVTPQNIIVPLIRSQKCMTAAVICYAHGENMCPVQTPPILSRQDKLNRGLCKVTTIRTITMGPHVITVKIYEESSEHLRTSGLFHWKHMAINTSKYHVWGFFRIQNYQLKARGFHRFWLPMWKNPYPSRIWAQVSPCPCSRTRPFFHPWWAAFPCRSLVGLMFMFKHLSTEIGWSLQSL